MPSRRTKNLAVLGIAVVGLGIVVFEVTQLVGRKPAVSLSAMRTIECRVEVPASDPTATTFQYEGETVQLGAPVSFHVSDAYFSHDALGNLAVGFTLAKSEWYAFWLFSGAQVHKRVAFLVEGRIFTMPVVSSALPPRGTLEGGRDGLTEAEVIALIETLKPQ